jgi:hypothetical protein
MISSLFLVCGVAVLSWALRTFRQPWLHRAGTIGVFVTSFLAGWLLGGHLWLGFLFASLWLLLPWVEILTRVRKMRLPRRQAIAPVAAPNNHSFPGISDLTREVEENDFEFVEDAGWEVGGLRHFYRLFYHPELRLQAAICLIEQESLSFYYLSLRSLAADQHQQFLTWNYPFSYGMHLPPTWHVQRVDGEIPFDEMVEKHRAWLAEKNPSEEKMAEQNPESMLEQMARSSAEQIDYNLQIGLLRPVGEEEICYSLRGLFYLWWQFLRDLVRLS